MSVKVLFVCLGNICRSPTAEGIFKARLKEQGLQHAVLTDSAGTAGWHVDKAPDARAIAAAAERGIDISGLRARQVTGNDFSEFDYILAMDEANLVDLKSFQPDDFSGRCCLYLDFAVNAPECEVPDPYYGGAEGFAHVLDLVEQAATGLLADIQKNHLAEVDSGAVSTRI
ncbi:low molecular weight protein-tyrosine-phosphatase [Gilvimarinus polysaccharolyticus]|uniref:low molecular weight protein-tyrosine-phosphatase n=1 Tax=Gilvimarinus polysaccharolyticus TaxID=863921 RepID=UPI0006733FF8|nr:low molecular weight protein-tyrosine-phosphatase [Gilvimarinus polysaccharolyticus]